MRVRLIVFVMVCSSSFAIAQERQDEERDTTLQLYDIREFLFKPKQFTAPEASIGEVDTSDSGASARLTFVEEEDLGEPTPADQVVTLIQDTVGHPEEWTALGGDLSFARDVNGLLAIKTTKANHQHIKALLSELATHRLATVEVEAWWFAVAPSRLREWLAPYDGRLTLNAEQTKGLLDTALVDPNAHLLGATHMICYDGQRAYVVGRGEQAVPTDIERDAESGELSPVLSAVPELTVLEVQPRVGGSREAIELALKSDFAVLTDRTSLWQSGGKDRLNAGDAEGGIVNAKLMVKAPANPLVQFRTAVRVLNGGAVVLAGSAPRTPTKPAPPLHIVLVLRVRAVP